MKGSKTTFEDLMDTLKELESDPPELSKQSKWIKDAWCELTVPNLHVRLKLRVLLVNALLKNSDTIDCASHRGRRPHFIEFLLRDTQHSMLQALL